MMTFTEDDKKKIRRKFRDLYIRKYGYEKKILIDAVLDDFLGDVFQPLTGN